MDHPVLTAKQMHGFKSKGEYKGWRFAVIDTTWPVSEGPTGMQAAVQRIVDEAARAVDDGFAFLVLSDRAAGLSLPF